MTPAEREKELVDRAWALFHKLTDDADKGTITDLLYEWGWCQAGAEELPKFARAEERERCAKIIRNFNSELDVGWASQSQNDILDEAERRIREG